MPPLSPQKTPDAPRHKAVEEILNSPHPDDLREASRPPSLMSTPAWVAKRLAEAPTDDASASQKQMEDFVLRFLLQRGARRRGLSEEEWSATLQEAGDTFGCGRQDCLSSADPAGDFEEWVDTEWHEETLDAFSDGPHREVPRVVCRMHALESFAEFDPDVLMQQIPGRLPGEPLPDPAGLASFKTFEDILEEMLEKQIPLTVAHDAGFLLRTDSRNTEEADTAEHTPQVEQASSC